MTAEVTEYTSEIEERVPHPQIAYAYLNIRVQGNMNEFLAFRREVLSRHPLYGTSKLEKSEGGSAEAGPSGEAVPGPVEPPAQSVAEPATVTSPEALSPREKARLRASQKGA
jgi:hypothetical protein